MKKLLRILALLVLAAVAAVGLMVRPDVPVEKLKAKYANESSKFITIDGLSVHYRDEGKGFPIVLLHGAASSLQAWDVWAKELSKEYRVIRLDLPGYGLTGPNAAQDYSMEWYAKFLDSFLRRLNVNDCYLAGNSLGGHIAYEYAFEKKGCVKKLILIDSGGYRMPVAEYNDPKVLAVKMARTPLLRPIVRYITPRFFVAMNIKQIYGIKERLSEDVIDRYYELMLREGNRQTFISMENMKFEDSSAHIKAIHATTLIMWGNRDEILPVQFAEYFHRDIAGSKLIIYDGVGHVPQEEIPEKTAADARAFLNQTTLM